MYDITISKFKIIQLAIDGKLNKLIIANKDRLTHFGY